MHKYLRLFIFFLLFHCLAFMLSDFSTAADKSAKGPKPAPIQETVAAKADELVKTDYFSVKIPAGWAMPYPVKQRPDGCSAVFADEKSNVSVTVNAIKAPLSLKEFSNSVLPNMKQSGIKPGLPIFENGLCKIIFQGMPQGEAWLGANGTLCTAVVILSESPNISPANALLKALTSPTPKLFPKKVK